jgi:hypothetical protein
MIGHHDHRPETDNKKGILKLNALCINEARKWIHDHPTETNIKNIYSSINNHEQLGEPSLEVTLYMIKQLRKETYTPKITDITQLYTRPDLAKTLDGHDWIRYLTLVSFFCIMWCSTWAINYINKIDSKRYQFYFDGTFDIVPAGVQQMVTLMVRRLGEKRAFPIINAYLRGKSAIDYQKLWKKLLSCYLA